MVAIVFESPDPTLAHARDTLAKFAVSFIDLHVPDRASLAASLRQAEQGGSRLYVVAVTSTDSLAHAVAKLTDQPVLAVPLDSSALPPLEALRAATRPGAVASLAIGKAGATNAAILAVSILANTDPALAARLQAFRDEQTTKVLADQLA
ncbi:MAG TPA: AIR carboxylase family protein [Tepidisphaeraceae bacterium]|nr:AIR carboxylase family protein [Tepidisphaeraceae bacterium]